MLEEVFRCSRVRQRIRNNPLGPILERFVAHLVARGHVVDVTHSYVFIAEHFGRWLGRRPVSSDAVESFITRHLPLCRCKTPAARNLKRVRPALDQLLTMMGLQVRAPESRSTIDVLLRRYVEHMIQVRGLADSTITIRVRDARVMMARLRIRRVRQLAGLTVDQVTRFVTREGRRFCPASCQVLAASTRSFLRFLLLHELIKRDLSIVVPSFANWRLASLPAIVSAEELERLVETVDTSTPIGLRNRAILLSLIDLGLRGSDVADLELDGVDLAGRVLHLWRRKQRESACVPMTMRLATAIGEYMRRGRPPGTSGASVFVQHKAPRGAVLSACGIHCVVIRQAKLAGLADRVRGSHIIRHSVASRMINAGATLKQIADLLGHRSVNTTAIYAKIDLASLTQVALPWPTSSEVML
jgi:integrase/recombinase XerD